MTMSNKLISRRTAVAAATALGVSGAVLSPAVAKADGVLGALSTLGGFLTGGSQAGQDGAAQPTQATARPVLLESIAPVEAASNPHAADLVPAEDLSNVDNLDWYYLNDAQLDMLRQHGFFCMLEGAGEEFFEAYETNRYSMMPNFVTTDAMLHTYHLYFSHLLKNTERAYLASELQGLSAILVQGAYDQLQVLRGTEWESAAVRNVAFFTVGACLQGLEVSVPADVAELANAEIALVYEAAGISDSPIACAMEDYSQYKPRGYYEGDAALEGYFRAMMWYGRINFAQKNEDLDRSALLITLLLNDGALDAWSKIYTVTSFFAGASDDNGYYEYAPLVERSYAGMPRAADLAGNDAAWREFHALTGQTAAPAINSIPVWDDPDTDTVEEGKGFRFMGQRFSIDEAVFQKLIYSEVEENAAGEQRLLPDALDIPAAFGSSEAASLLETTGAYEFAGYTENLEALKQGIAQADDTLWKASLYAQWLRTLKPLCDEKGEGYPWFMRSQLWSRRCLQTFAGSYAELKHDTILYSKQVMAEMGGGELPVHDDRGYVEPEPEVFGRLGALTQATSQGLATYGMLVQEDADNLGLLSDLAYRLQEIARKELNAETPTDDEFDLIRTFGGQIEHFWQEVYKNETDNEYFTTREFPAAIVADVATDPNGSCLELGTGSVSKLYVLVPMDGVLRLMTGAVYSFYQFVQPLNERLTDTEWRRMLGIELGEDGSYTEPAIDPVWWTQDFSLSWRTM